MQLRWKPEAGKTLIVFDEIQQVERGLHSLKYFADPLYAITKLLNGERDFLAQGVNILFAEGY